MASLLVMKFLCNDWYPSGPCPPTRVDYLEKSRPLDVLERVKIKVRESAGGLEGK